jgi:hypothetical protein
MKLIFQLLVTNGQNRSVSQVSKAPEIDAMARILSARPRTVPVVVWGVRRYDASLFDLHNDCCKPDSVNQQMSMVMNVVSSSVLCHKYQGEDRRKREGCELRN